MKIIRIPLLENKNSINSIEISYDNLFLAFEGAENEIWVYKYSDFKKILEFEPAKKSQIIDKEEEEKNEDNEQITKLRRQYWFNDPLSLQKIILKEHVNSISAILFLHTDSHIMFSSGFDKYIIIWKLDENKMIGERVRKIPSKQEITDMKLFPDDTLLFVGYINGEINIFSCDYAKNQFHSIAIFAEHDDYLNSIVLSPNIMQDGLFVSLSDKGKLILSQIFMKNTGNLDVKIKKKFSLLKILITLVKAIPKKIDWSPDGSMIISVDHKFIQTKPIIHARLIFLDDLDNSQALIGHVASPLIAKFSKVEYYYNNEEFLLLVTCDKSSNIKIWKMNTKTRKCTLLFSNDDFSDSIIRDIIFSNDGKYLFIVSSFGSISIIVFDDLKILNKEYLGNKNLINGYINMNPGVSKYKKKVIPEMIKGYNPIIMKENNSEMNQNIDGIYIDNESFNSNLIKGTNRNNNISPQLINRDINQILNLNLLKSNLFQSIDNTQINFFNTINEHLNRLPSVNKKIFKFERIKTVEGYYLILAYENNIPYNTSIISLRLSNNYIIYMKQINGFIKLFTYSNICYAFYDSKSTLNIYSILGTPYYMNNYIADVTKMELFNNYILLITNDNQIIILDFINKKNIFTSKLLCLSLNNASVMEKINNLYFIGLDNIIFDIVQSTVFSNVTNRKIIYYNCLNNEFTLSSDDALTQTDKFKINEKDNMESPYNALMKQIHFDYKTKYSEENYILIDRQITACFENLKNDNNKSILVASLQNFANTFHNLVFILQDFEFIHKRYNF